uniref:Amino acid transporter transmembrane domain-containing protein n=1 Tax=Mucochytrium quahogii TaxID=96639 RepID=A0A7S2WNU2_9STRA|mmetsp:Transcript_5313/g.11739  ORF Transcript_5313/g.11739 Transcript_5313/m.11739 type:complete len:515 (+) Transcript_5313:201-1745(+)
MQGASAVAEPRLGMKSATEDEDEEDVVLRREEIEERRNANGYPLLEGWEEEEDIMNAADENKLSFWQALSTSVNYNLGLAILSFPFQIVQTGTSGVVVVIVACFVCWLTARMLGLVMRAPHVHSYADIGGYAASHAFSGNDHVEAMATLVIRWFQILELFCYVIYNLKTVSGSFLALSNQFESNALLLWGVCFAVMCPVLTLLSPGRLSKCSVFGIFSYLLLVALLVGSNIEKLIDDPAGFDWPFVTPGTSIWTWLRAYGGIFLLFAGHAVYPSIHENMKKKKEYGAVVDYTFIVLVFIIIGLGALCPCAYGYQLTELPTGNLIPGSAPNYIGQVLIILKCFCAVPVILYPIVVELSSRVTIASVSNNQQNSNILYTPLLDQDFQNLLSPNGEEEEQHLAPISYSPFLSSNLQQVQEREPNELFKRRVQLVTHLISFGVLVVAFGVTVVVPSLEFIMTLVGSLFAIHLAVTLPALCYLFIDETVKGRKALPYQTIVVWGIISSVASLIALFMPE